MAISAYGKFFSWEDSLFFQGHDDEDEHVRILAHRVTMSRYRDPETKAEKDFGRSSGVYLLHAADEEIIYVGQAKELARRLVAHSGDHLRNRWTHYSWFATSTGQDADQAVGVDRTDAETTNAHSNQPTLSLDTLEAILRTAIEPRLNLQSGRWGETPQYAQSVDYAYFYLREVWENTEKIRKRVKKLKR